MKIPIHVLVIEDSEDDKELMLSILRQDSVSQRKVFLNFPD